MINTGGDQAGGDASRGGGVPRHIRPGGPPGAPQAPFYNDIIYIYNTIIHLYNLVMV